MRWHWFLLKDTLFEIFCNIKELDKDQSYKGDSLYLFWWSVKGNIYYTRLSSLEDKLIGIFHCLSSSDSYAFLNKVYVFLKTNPEYEHKFILKDYKY